MLISLLVFGVGALATPLRISLPPAMGAVPVVLAQSWNLFDEDKVQVTVIPLPGQRDRLVAFQAGQVDALITDLTSAIMLISQMPAEAEIVSTVYHPVSGAHTPVALIADAAHARSLEDLATGGKTNSVRIAVPRQSDLEFSLDQLFKAHGLTPPVKQYIGQDNLLVNATWVLLGMVKAGVFPQPYVDYVLNYQYEGKPNLIVVSDFSDVTIPPTVIVFHRSYLASHPAAVQAFLGALAKAIDRFNAAEAEELRELGWKLAVNLFFPGLAPEEMKPADRQRVEQAIEGVHIPTLPPLGDVPCSVFREVEDWALAKGYIEKVLSCEEAVAERQQ